MNVIISRFRYTSHLSINNFIVYVVVWAQGWSETSLLSRLVYILSLFWSSWYSLLAWAADIMWENANWSISYSFLLDLQ